ncbi:hypothetical protein Tco_1281327 [Tanacetum coccineum]
MPGSTGSCCKKMLALVVYDTALNLLLERFEGGRSWLQSPEYKVKALGANGNMSGSRVGVVWMEVGGRIMRARVLSRVVLGLVVMGLSDWTLLFRWVEVGLCWEWVQECSHQRDHSPSLGEELEKVNQMTQSLKELELGDEAFFPHA